jgi:hypothetical protein
MQRPDSATALHPLPLKYFADYGHALHSMSVFFSELFTLRHFCNCTVDAGFSPFSRLRTDNKARGSCEVRALRARSVLGANYLFNLIIPKLYIHFLKYYIDFPILLFYITQL